MWLSAGDKHFVYPIKTNYQKASFKAAMKHVKKFDCAIDIGAHVGIFTRYMAERFKEVHAFEPELRNFECLLKNCPLTPEGAKVILWNYGIAEKDMLGYMLNPAPHNSGAWEFRENVFGIARCMKLGTSLRPDFIKIDVQGMEARALTGCKEVLERDKPVLLVECDRGDRASKYLESVGYEIAERTGSNITWTHK